MRLLTTRDVAKKLGVTARRIVALIEAGRLPAMRLGRDWLIQPDDLKLVRHRRPGRPRKERKGGRQR